MKVINYLSSVPKGNTNRQKELLLLHFHEGVLKHNDQSSLQDQHIVQQTDVAVIQGWVYADHRPRHLKLRHDVIQQQINNNQYVIVADANLFLFANKENPHGYLRYSANGIFPTTGIYFDSLPDSNRWKQIAKDCNISLLPQVKTGDSILICCQRNSGWSMKGTKISDWLGHVVKKVRKYTDRKIIIRPHPGDKRSYQWISEAIELTPIKKLVADGHVRFSIQGVPIEKDLQNAWAVVNHNSSSIVGPIIQGYHAFVTDPTDSQCKDVSNTDFSKLDSPDVFDRETWLAKKAMSHWKFDELKSGEAWAHFKNYLSQ